MKVWTKKYCITMIVWALICAVVSFCICTYLDRSNTLLQKVEDSHPELSKFQEPGILSFGALLADGNGVDVQIKYDKDYPMSDGKKISITHFVLKALQSPEIIEH
jgi:hypothetical protein